MKIKKLHVRNFRCFEDFEIEFNTGNQDQGGLTVLVAKNGEGKTAVLDAVNIALGPYFRKMPNVKGAIFHIHDRRNIKKIEEMDEHGYLKLSATFQNADRDMSPTIDIKRECYLDKNKKIRTSTKDGKELEDYAEFCCKQSYHSDFVLPLFVYYPDSRLWNDQLKDDETAVIINQDRLFGYSGANNHKCGFMFFYSWYIDLWRSLMDQKLKKLDNKPSFNAEALAYYETLNLLLESTLKEALASTGWNTLDYDNGDKTLYVVNSITSEKADILSLSAGNRIIIGIIGDLVHRCCVLNAKTGIDVLKKTSGIVLIDEIELHLHPSWQQQILPTLQTIFPQIQFIVTTHSPQVVSSVPAECVRIIDNGEVVPFTTQTQGVETQDILAQIFGTDAAPAGDAFVKMLDEYAKVEANNQADSEYGRNLRQQLTDHFGAQYSPLQRIEIHRKYFTKKQE